MLKMLRITQKNTPKITKKKLRNPAKARNSEMKKWKNRNLENFLRFKIEIEVQN